jgi:hypothetical protein
VASAKIGLGRDAKDFTDSRIANRPLHAQINGKALMRRAKDPGAAGGVLIEKENAR